MLARVLLWFLPFTEWYPLDLSIQQLVQCAHWDTEIVSTVHLDEDGFPGFAQVDPAPDWFLVVIFFL